METWLSKPSWTSKMAFDTVKYPMLLKGLAHLCTSSRGATSSVVTIVFKHLLPHLLMMGENKAVYAATIPQSAQTIKNHALGFVLHLLETYGEPVRTPARVLLQHLCVKVPDKAEYRTRMANTIIAVLCKLPTPSYARMIHWIYKFSRNAKIGYRSFALSLAAELLAEPERIPDDTIGPEYTGLLTHCFLVQMILARCSDIAPTVRARAVASFGLCCTTTQPLTQSAIKSLITPRPSGHGQITRVVPTPEPADTAPSSDNTTSDVAEAQLPEEPLPTTPAAVEDVANTTPKDPVSYPSAKTPANINTPGGIILTPGGEISLIEGKGVLSMLRTRAQKDDRANVRKAAVQTLESLIRLDGTLLNTEDLSVLNNRCSDPSLAVRRQALRSLTDMLVDMPLNVSLQRCWLDGVLPLVMDRETTCQEKCLEAIQNTILDSIVPYQRSNNDHHKMVWQLLTFLGGNEAVDLRRYLQRACQQLGRNKNLKPSLAAYLQTHVGTENNMGVWLLLSSLAPFMKLPHRFVVNYWMDNARGLMEGDSETVHRVLTVLGYIAKNIEKEKSTEIADGLKNRLMNFDSPPELIAVTANTLGKLCRAQSAGDEAVCKVVMDTCFTDLLVACDAYLSKVILDEDPNTPVDEEKTICHIFTLGEIAQLCPAKTPKRATMLVQSLVAAPVITTMDGSTQDPSTQMTTTSALSSKRTSAEWATTQNNGSTQSTQSTQLTQGGLSQFRGSKMSSRVRAFAFTTLGKLCLQNEDLAKKVVAAMARELEVATDQAVRNNVVVILCDLCVRYTSVVDRYISNISACLRDHSPIIRKQALTLITHLLQEDFLKWKGSLFFRFIVTLVDEYKEIREFSEFCLIHVLMQRHPGMFANHLIECIFHFNSYDGHHAFNKFSQTEDEKYKFSMKGRANAAKRQKIYLFLLEHLTDEQRFSLTAKLTQEVLGAVVDDLMPINTDTSPLIQDALFILASKEIKLAVIRNLAVDEDAVEAADMAAVVMNVAKKTLITQVMKRNVIENIVPTVIGLKHRLETHHSPLLKDLMMYLRELVKDYKSEVKDIMSADRQLGNEIEFDLRKFEEQQLEEEKRKQEQALLSLVSPVGSPLIQGSPVISPGRGSVGSHARSPKGTTPLRRGSPISTPGSPGAPGTPRASPKEMAQKTPLLNLASNTPFRNRRTSIATLAIMNSARKAMEKAQRVSLKDGRHTGSEVSEAGSHPKRVGWADEGTADGSHTLVKEIGISTASNEAASPSFTTPKQNRNRPAIRRAISTPAANMSVLGDITFNQGDLTLIPGTPNHRIGSLDNDANDGSDVIHMMSPDQPRAKPRTWNIKSPMDPVKTRLMQSEDTTPVTDVTPTVDSVKKKREVLVPRRSTRRSLQEAVPVSSEQGENESFVSLNGSRRRSLRRK